MRKLKCKEIESIKNLLSSNSSALEKIISKAEKYWVQEMRDGGMGGLQFVVKNDEERSLGITIA